MIEILQAMDWDAGDLAIAVALMAVMLGLALLRLARSRRYHELDRSADMASLIFPPNSQLGPMNAREPRDLTLRKGRR